MTFDRARAVADAVMLEGYVLYPYRATAPKNLFRWAFGVLAPRDWSEAGGCEPWWMSTQCLVEGDEHTEVEGQLRFLYVVRRTVEIPAGGGWSEVGSREVNGRLLVPWEEGVVREIGFQTRLGTEHDVPFSLGGGFELERVGDVRVVRRYDDIHGRIRIVSERVKRGLYRLTIRAENHTPIADPRAPRNVALRQACIGSHLLLASRGGSFVSLLDPPPHALAAAAICRQERAWPVLAGPPGQRDLVLAAPIILYDHPQIAPESSGDFFDATEIDELLTLRTATLTPEEKRQARATDPRAAALLDRVAAMTPDELAGLHGARRPPFEPGDRVRLRPGPRRTDAQDLLFEGMTATVREVRWDIEGEPHLAVTIDQDPAAELHEWYGRYHYYRCDEVERLS